MPGRWYCSLSYASSEQTEVGDSRVAVWTRSYSSTGYNQVIEEDSDSMMILTSPILYHESPSENRESILQYGLHQRFSELYEEGEDHSGMTFLSDVMPEYSRNFDVWEVDVSGLELWEDSTTEPFPGHNWYCTGSVPPERIKLVTRLESKRSARP